MLTPQTSSRSDYPSRIRTLPPLGASRYNLLGGIFVTIGALGVMAIGWNWGVIQHHRLTAYLPTTATIIDSYVKEPEHQTSTTYIPVIVYRYRVAGGEYQCDRVRASGDPSALVDWAHEVVSRHPVGSTCIAWYSPYNPSSAFIVREVEAAPYGFALVPAFFVVFGIYLIVMRIQTGRPITAPALAGTGWYRLTEERSFRSRIVLGAVGAICLYVYGGVISADYIYLNREFDLGAFFLTGVTAVGGLIFLRPLVNNLRLRRVFADVELYISQPQIRPGDRFLFRLRQETFRPLQIDFVSVGVVCIQDKFVLSGGVLPFGRSFSVVSRLFWSQWKDIKIVCIYHPISPLEMEGDFAISADAFPTSPWPTGSFPLYRWQISLGIVARGQPKLAVRYPIQVDPPR